MIEWIAGVVGVVTGVVLALLVPRLYNQLRWRSCWLCVADCFECYRNSWHLSSEEMWWKLHDCIVRCVEKEGCG